MLRLGGCVLAAALAAAPSALSAQAVVGIQNLDFGNVIPAVPTTIAKNDPVHSGQVRISGAGFFRSVTLTFTLPTVMNGPAGATMPITFSSTDAGISAFFPSINTQNTFNPNAPYNAFIWFGNALVFLGGRVNPSPTQRGGSYSANIVLTVIFL